MNPSESHDFVHGVPRFADLGYVSCANREAVKERIQHAVLFDWDAGEFGEITPTPWLIAGLCVARYPMEQLVAVGESGDVIVYGSGDRHQEKMGDDREGPASLGPLRGVRAIDGMAYAVGMRRQVYQRGRGGLWTRLDDIPAPAAGDVVGFEAIDGFSERDLYAVGWKGEIWRSDGRTWTADAPLTNLILTDVCCAGDGQVYACGQQGLILRGKRGKWEVIDTGRYQVDYWSLTFFKGSLYVAGSRILLRLDGNEVVPVMTGEDPAGTFGHLSQIDEVMWSTGAHDLMAFDGTSWTRLG